MLDGFASHGLDFACNFGDTFGSFFVRCVFSRLEYFFRKIFTEFEFRVDFRCPLFIVCRSRCERINVKCEEDS